MAIVVAALAAGLVVGLWLGQRVTGTGPPTPTAGTIKVAAAATTPIASAAPSVGQMDWLGSVDPSLVDAYYANRQTSAGLGAVVCTTGDGLSCQGLPPTDIKRVYSDSAASRIPGADQLWSELVAVRIAGRSAVDTILAYDLSPALFNAFQVISSPDGSADWGNSSNYVRQASSNGAVVFADLGRLPPGRNIIIVNSALSAADPHSFAWSALAIEVSGEQALPS